MTFRSIDPATGDTLWEGAAAGQPDVARAVSAARTALDDWADRPLADRVACVRRYGLALQQNMERLAVIISRETGKPLWEGRQEVASMVAKIEASITAQQERSGIRDAATTFGRAVLRHRPHGVMAVFGPYNFPGHLPNGHIVPALLAGDTVVFKPSEETPLVGETMVGLWQEAGLPAGVLNLVQGGRDTGRLLAEARIDGLLFTGSAATGAQLRQAFVDRPDVILALELGGNNPLIAWDGDVDAAASIIVASAFATSGQRCSCARRLIVPAGPVGDRMVEATTALAARLRIGRWDADPEPALGPLISEAAADQARRAVDALIVGGARIVRPLDLLDMPLRTFVTPAILDVTGIDAPDVEIFAPVLQVVRVPDFDAAITAANATAFGLAAGLISNEQALWDRYTRRARAGVLNLNRPTTGAAGSMPFGGVGASGNHRPSAYYAADYCAYPVASFEAPTVQDISAEIRGLSA
ncbi:succinylglutamate-semialdehyde dehydrogenase [Sphingomonas montana]|uniref:succinylglutamate-semialdehyde dehydrogenase n=1 Tax=Sphingomonas montana TaxID=1843236 RepID=UPI00096EE026|nr:succinylglutamate-semialdehyde dehydrogenase [Sphingomonas montana]